MGALIDMLNCRKNSYRVVLSLDQDLSLLDRLAMRLHLSICKPCKRFSKQMAALDLIQQRYCQGEWAGQEQHIRLSKKARQRILSRLQEKPFDD